MNDASKANVKITSAEVSNLWVSYINSTMMVCGIKYFAAKAEDDEIRSVLEDALELSARHVQQAAAFFREENYPVPKGFNDEDVDVNVPRLYSDRFALLYLLNMGAFLLSSYSLTLTTSTRLDIVRFYSNQLDEARQLHNRCKQIALEKGLLSRPPHIPPAEQVEFVQSQNFFNGWFGERHPLLAIEISNLSYNIMRNELGSALIIGFSQVAESKQVRDFMERGRDISRKHIEVFSSILHEEFLPSPPRLDDEVTDSTVAPFSEKLMMFHISALTASGIAQYGISMSTSMRRDLQAHYVRLSAEIARFTQEGAKIMIENGWMEHPPQTIDRKKLAKNKG